MCSEVAWLYLDLNSFFASVEQQLRPELRGRPVAVVPTQTDATCAIAASYEARAYGIKTGTKIYDARRLCPSLSCITANHEHYVYFHERITRTIERLIPIYQAESIDEFSCRLDPSQSTPAKARALGRHIKQALAQEIGPFVRCSIGIAPNRFLAKTASNLEKPDGLQVLAAADVPTRINHWPLTKLVGIGAAMEKRLMRAGITSIEQLYRLSPKQMRKIWGNVGGERYYYQLRGIELPEEPTNRSTIGHSHVLDPAWRPPEMALEIMRRLTLKAGSRLRRLGYYTSRMDMSLRLENGTRLGCYNTFYRCCDNVALQTRAFELWHHLTDTRKTQRIKKISVSLNQLIAEHTLQPELFDTLHASEIQRTKRREALSRTMDALNARFGRDTVGMGQLPGQARSFTGTKVAFTRIPDQEEFYE